MPRRKSVNHNPQPTIEPTVILPVRHDPTPGKVGSRVPYWRYEGRIYASELPDFIVPHWLIIDGISDVTDPLAALSLIDSHISHTSHTED